MALERPSAGCVDTAEPTSLAIRSPFRDLQRLAAKRRGRKRPHPSADGAEQPNDPGSHASADDAEDARSRRGSSGSASTSASGAEPDSSRRGPSSQRLPRRLQAAIAFGKSPASFSAKRRRLAHAGTEPLVEALRFVGGLPQMAEAEVQLSRAADGSLRVSKDSGERGGDAGEAGSDEDAEAQGLPPGADEAWHCPDEDSALPSP
mmetsp:Transcript_75023/g.232035  ORF Transcript_75023/g.232035 Transcript_75023/m.232035 type:complete len:205 (+) Transcript_75023:55-669(+)